jgi:hypothetical protein
MADPSRPARERYGCLVPWEDDPIYGRSALTGRYRSVNRRRSKCHRVLKRRLEFAEQTRQLLTRRKRLVVAAERYYRRMLRVGGVRNLRDSRMFETLQRLLAFHGPAARAVVWEHIPMSSAWPPSSARWASTTSRFAEAYGPSAFGRIQDRSRHRSSRFRMGGPMERMRVVRPMPPAMSGCSTRPGFPRSASSDPARDEVQRIIL